MQLDENRRYRMMVGPLPPIVNSSLPFKRGGLDANIFESWLISGSPLGNSRHMWFAWAQADLCWDPTAHNCHTEAACTWVSSDGSFLCACNEGYRGDGLNCTGIDECVEKAHECSPYADCLDTFDSYTCECWPGYDATDEGKCCVLDICSRNDTCVSGEKCLNDVNVNGFVCNKEPVLRCPSDSTHGTTKGLDVLVSTLADYGEAFISDEETPSLLTVSYSHPEGSSLPVGSTTVTISVTDPVSFTVKTCEFTVTVIDEESPEVTCPGSVIRKQVGTVFPIAIYPEAANATDNADSAPTLVYSPANNSQLTAELTTVTVTATDSLGNIGTCKFIISVETCPSNSLRDREDLPCVCNEGYFRDLTESTEIVICRCVECVEDATCSGTLLESPQTSSDMNSNSSTQAAATSRRLQSGDTGAASGGTAYKMQQHAQPIPNDGFTLVRRYPEVTVQPCPVKAACKRGNQEDYQTTQPGTFCVESNQGARLRVVGD
uniref:HYR domain-containing protein n=1 Tax=Chromera velia CCMP2878 TaxID=1169474 RepID=A0A0G4H901_9ALVE|eukprot:Cvel_25112.t1-p1 / transcript=Cvel_25112.t1 / gene=Cvel_25112 / organism=Chromera_velia_CCMP2878 / gene_product=Fibrillin-1, putative / transcript_product=Fibrillin-1, putative / location=Cvel_scaffold2802:12783-19411(+) / protein_length=490 / sequence_SO=supercontig / SO=protein_coding / is_pseudo=false